LEQIMYAVVATGGKQYRVEAGTTLEVERLAGDPGASVTFDRVLMIADGDAVTIGTPVVTGASVVGTVLGDALGPKLVIFKFKQKVKYRRRTGHRQSLTRVRIDAIHPTEATARKRVAAKPTPESKPIEADAEVGTTDSQAAPSRPRTPPARAAGKAGTVTSKAREPKARQAAAAERAPSQTENSRKPRARRAAKPKAKE
jgi:large subunit ribosomal protein L21